MVLLYLRMRRIAVTQFQDIFSSRLIFPISDLAGLIRRQVGLVAKLGYDP